MWVIGQDRKFSIEISGLYYKCFTIVMTVASTYKARITNIIYDRNDSGQYYKTRITIVIDDPS